MPTESPRLILSPHIPKCAGISLSHFFMELYGKENVLLFYDNRFFIKEITSDRKLGDILEDTPSVLYRLKKSFFQSSFGLTLLRILRQYKSNPPYELKTIPKGSRRVIHGHFRIHPALVTQVDLVIVLRDPLDRVLSLFRYLQKEKKSGRSTPGWFDPSLSVDKFILLPQNLETYSRYLNGIPLQEFRYIGVSENLQGFCRQFDPKARIPIKHQNRSPKFGISLQESTIEQFKRKNVSDYEIYDQALNLIKERKKKTNPVAVYSLLVALITCAESL